MGRSRRGGSAQRRGEVARVFMKCMESAFWRLVSDVLFNVELKIQTPLLPLRPHGI